MMATPVRIEEMTFRSLRLTLRLGDIVLGHATGFVVKADGRLFLVSNRHVFSGRNWETGKPLSSSAAIPDCVKIAHHDPSSVGSFVHIQERLTDGDGAPRFIGHPDPRVDVAALAIEDRDDVAHHITDPSHNTALQARITVASTVCIIGFPFGLSSNEYFPIWKTGSIATEIELPYQGLPCFLVDAATRGGMSGSPVYAVFRGPYLVEGGGTALGSNEVSRFMGIYSGRLHIPASIREGLSAEDGALIGTLGSDLGMVWRPHVVDEVISTALNP